MREDLGIDLNSGWMSKFSWEKATEEVIRKNREFLIALGKRKKDR